MSCDAPIGVFDSGVGGLSVLREIRRLLPAENFIYVADSGFVPYGSKSPEIIRERSDLLTRFLIARGAKSIVIACNTATAAAAAFLRETYPLPIIAMEPAVKPAAAATRTGVVGVLATVGTLKSAQFAALLARFGSGIRVVTQPAPGLVELVEHGDLCGATPTARVQSFIEPLKAAGADVIVLGCTHYPFLLPLISQAAGPDIKIIETGTAVARQVRHVLSGAGLLREHGNGGEEFFTTGEIDAASRTFRLLWNEDARVHPLPIALLTTDACVTTPLVSEIQVATAPPRSIS